MPAVSSAPDLGGAFFGKSAAQQVLQADAVPARLKSNVMFQKHRMMEYRTDKFILILAFSICTVTTALLFYPAMAGLYLSTGKYLITLALALGMVALTLTWKNAFQIGGWRQYAMATIKTLILLTTLCMAEIVLIVTHSGI